MCSCRKWKRICYSGSESDRIKATIDKLKEIDIDQKENLKNRYAHILQEFTTRCNRYSILFHLGHFIITVGSLIVPALLSVQYADNEISVISSTSIKIQIYWATWVLSLLVTTFNGIITLYKVDKKYYFLHTTRERLRSEGWQYFQLTGRYAEHPTIKNDPKQLTSHKIQYIYFCHQVEKIRMGQIAEEYYKYDVSQDEKDPTVDKNKQLFPQSFPGTSKQGRENSLAKILSEMVDKDGVAETNADTLPEGAGTGLVAVSVKENDKKD